MLNAPSSPAKKRKASEIGQERSAKRTRSESSNGSQDSDKVQKAEHSLIDVEASVQALSCGNANESEQKSIAELVTSSGFGLQDDVSTYDDDQSYKAGQALDKRDVNEYANAGAYINAKKRMEKCPGLDIYQNTGKVPIIAPNEGKIIGSGVYKRLNWTKANKKVYKQEVKKKIINFIVPQFSSFIDMFGEMYKNRLLEYEFHYERLELLCSYHNDNNTSNTEIIDSDPPEDGEMNLSLENDEKMEYAFDLYDQAINILRNGGKADAFSKLKYLAEEGMPHAQYALAIIKFKELWANNVEHGKSSKQDPLIFKIIGWLNDADHDKNLRPLNTSLLLKVQLYDIGGYGKEVERITRLDVKDSLDEILYATQNTKISFDEELVKEDSLVTPGKIIGKTVDEMNDFEFIVRCAMYEVLKRRMLQPTLHKKHTAMADAFFKISRKLPRARLPFAKIFKYVRAEMIYGHAINLLMYKGNGENKEAVSLLNESCKLGHPGALYLRGTLFYRGNDFQFILKDHDQHQSYEYFCGLKKFAVHHRNQTAACIVANEYLKCSSYIVARSEEKAQKILEESGCGRIWDEIYPNISS